METYSDNDRKKVLEYSKKDEFLFQNVNQAFAFSMYDVMRLQLEELHRIGNAMESLLLIIQQE